jgi:hypothetical protein
MLAPPTEEKTGQGDEAAKGAGADRQRPVEDEKAKMDDRSSNEVYKQQSSRPENSNSRSGASAFFRPIPQSDWNSLPSSCLSRMMEFNSIRDEYARSFPDGESTQSKKDQRRLTLANLMELAMINSREYQTRKEILFRTALALSRQRYEFELNPIPFGNGTSANYSTLRSGGATRNRLTVPSGVGVQRTLATGGEFLARFANSVVVSFNGPSGFAADVGSELIMDFQQTLLQRDVRFEDLTQAERDVVYAARDYIRFRKQLFRDIANLYYNLLLNYRSIEISSQDYFTNLRGFLQSQYEYRTAEKIPRIQVDQFEQNVLRTQSNLVNNCFALEAALDQLKFRIGLPTEMDLFIDLTELQSIALRDEFSVARRMINRARSELLTASAAAIPDAATLANVAEVLADRMSNILELQTRIEKSNTGKSSGAEGGQSTGQLHGQAIQQAKQRLDKLTKQLQLLGLRMQIEVLKADLDAQLKSDVEAPPLRVLIRALALADAELQVVQLVVDDRRGNQELPDDWIKKSQDLFVRYNKLLDFMSRMPKRLLSNDQDSKASVFREMPEQAKQAQQLVRDLAEFDQNITQELLPKEGQTNAQMVQVVVDQTIALSDKLLQTGPDGWEEIVLDHDETLLTGLVQRLDLMNRRGELADAWRQIKLAGDDLRSIIDLRATHVLRTKSGQDSLVNFSFDDSETRLSAGLDTPLNRRLQRNNFRLALINYNAGLRNLIALEDSIKLDLREDLRQLALDRNQYTISLASAALAFERVISTRMRLQLAVQNVAARDFLESQQAYTNALNAIARQHVNYITDRIELFFDLEGFEVDQCGNWTGANGDFAPTVNTDFPGRNPRPYDNLPSSVRYSPTIRSMECIGPGQSTIAK